MSGKKANSNKSSAKSTKAEKASFDKVINALEKEKEAFVTPKSQKIMFWIASIIAAVAPLALFWGGGSLSESKYWSAIYEGRVHENVIWYLICVAISVVLLVHSYNVQATRTRKSLLLSREPAGTSERAAKELKTVTANEAAYYSLFTLNAVYLAVFLINVAYVLPPQELSERLNYALASSGAAVVTAFTVALRVL